LVWALLPDVNVAAGWVIVAEAVVVQPCVSVTVTVYVAAIKLLAVDVV
jgi:hypothetical protein